LNNFIKYLKTNLKLIYILIGINLIAFLLTNFISILLSGNESYSLLLLGASYAPFVLQGEVWRLITAAFLHGGIFHLGFNMYALYISGTYIEHFYGAKKLFIAYILTGLGASLLSMFFELFGIWSSNGLDTSMGISVGSSGAVFGLIGILIGNKLRKNIYEPGLNIDSNQLFAIVFYNLLIGFGVNLTGGSLRIDNWAHLGGLITGILLGFIFNTVNNFKKSTFDKILINTLFVISLILFFGSFIAQVIYIIFNFI
jgi:rhomboid protease GluP